MSFEFQLGVKYWMHACFGKTISLDQVERADRFIEEALELCQTIEGFGPERAHALVDYVFSRPVGNREQEVGGVMVTLAALCNVFGIIISAQAEIELGRVWTKIEKIREKQAAKPTGSALPVTQGAALRDAREDALKEALNVTPKESETHLLQAEGYTFGWQQAISAYRAAIRALLKSRAS